MITASASVKLQYPAILETIKTCLVTDRTESHAFLVWFLQHYFRLDETEAQDAVCDGFDDKCVDGIYVDDNLETIFILQCKLVKNPNKTLGDTQIKEFAGSLAQFRTANKISKIASTTSNTEHSNLINSSNLAKLISDGYALKGVFVANINAHPAARDYLSVKEDIQLFDKSTLEARFISDGPTKAIGTPVSFDIFGYECSQYQIGDVKVILAPLKGNELIQLDGIASSELFAWNVRGSLGRTKVNKDIGKSIDDHSEHQNFLLYHNGMTILCEEVERIGDKIRIAKYSVVNGCQSLTSLFDHRRKLTDDLRILTRLIELLADHELAEKITHHSNNQNPINARDLQSNSAIQRRLQNEFGIAYSNEVFYRIKRGEQAGAPHIIENDEAGRLLLAFDSKQPWTRHQTYKILDELHADIFGRPEVTAHRIVAVSEMHTAIKNCIYKIDSGVIANYRLTQYFLPYLLRQAIELDEIGKAFCAAPDKFISEQRGRERIRSCAETVIKDIIIDLNAELRERADAGTPFDYKRELKSPNPVRELSSNIIPPYQKAVARGRASSFGDEWGKSGKKRRRV